MLMGTRLHPEAWFYGKTPGRGEQRVKLHRLISRLPKRSKLPKVFGVGLNKTGTKSLAASLERFGSCGCNYDLALTRAVMEGRMAPVWRTVRRYDCFEDWPWPLIYRELDQRYPGSKFILTIRLSSEIWMKSLMKHAERIGPTEFRKLVYGYEMPHGHEEEHIRFYEEHNRAVRNYFRERPDQFLEVCWEKGDGWPEICSFLGVPLVTDEPFPHLNSSAMFQNQAVEVNT
jgi:hypothetical protein